MLATAYMYCNDSLPEGPEPAEVGGFVFEVREKQMKLARCVK
jgi:hypothetical protein